MDDLKSRSFLFLQELKATPPKLIGFSGLRQKWMPIEDVRREIINNGKVGKYDRKAKGFTKKISGDDHIK